MHNDHDPNHLVAVYRFEKRMWPQSEIFLALKSASHPCLLNSSTLSFQTAKYFWYGKKSNNKNLLQI